MSLLLLSQLVRPFSSMLRSIHGMASAEMSFATTCEPGTSLAILTDLEPVAAMASATVMLSRPSARSSMTLTSRLNDICSLKKTDPIFFPGPWVECCSGTAMSVLPSRISS